MFTRIAVSVAVAFLGAYPFAVESGLMVMNGRHGPSADEPLIFVSGFILFFLTLSLIGPAIGLAHKTLATLKQVEERPRPINAWTMLCLGTVCAIASINIQYNAAHRGAPQGLSMNLDGIGASPHIAMVSSGSVVLGILTILTFFLGTSLIGLGVWASLKPPPPVICPPVKPPVREFEEVTA